MVGALNKYNYFIPLKSTYIDHKKRWHTPILYFGKYILDVDLYIYFVSQRRWIISQNCYFI